MSDAVRRRFADGRWHFQHGPIDCIVGADGDRAAVDAALERAWRRFGSVLAELVGELALLRTDLASPAGAAVAPRGPIARRMVAACRPHAEGGRFITAMAAVAGSVAEDLIGCFGADTRIARAYVNNGGDIALHLAGDATFTVGWVADADAAVVARRADAPRLDGTFEIDAASGIRGIATSGWRGRSFSLGIADSVTVLARTASAADALATVVANAVDADDPRIRRAPANALRDDSDLGERLVTSAVAPLPASIVEAALARGVAAARAERAAGRLVAAALCLQGQVRTVEAARHAGALRGIEAAVAKLRDLDGSGPVAAPVPPWPASAASPGPSAARAPAADDAATLCTDRVRHLAMRGAVAAAVPPHRASFTSSPGP